MNRRQAPDIYRHYKTPDPDGPAPHSDRLYCDHDPLHRVRMEWVSRHGIRTGSLEPWCDQCRCYVVATKAPPVTISERERLGEPRNRFKPGPRHFEEEQTDGVRARNAAIRLAWAGGVKPELLAKDHNISPERVRQIVHGRRRKTA